MYLILTKLLLFTVMLVACEFAYDWQSPFATALTFLVGWVLCDLACAYLKRKS